MGDQQQEENEVQKENKMILLIGKGHGNPNAWRRRMNVKIGWKGLRLVQLYSSPKGRLGIIN